MIVVQGIIQSEEFYIWDNWGFVDSTGVLHIYAQYCEKALCQCPEDRYWQVHIEHFVSRDQGKTFLHCGPAIEKSQEQDAFDAYNIWSGCAIPLDGDCVLALYTGLQLSREPLANNRKYALQSIGASFSRDGGYTFEKMKEPLISPVRDYELLQEKGYYLGPKDTLGAIDDPDGTFMCLRDPEVFKEGHKYHIVFGAKAQVIVDGQSVIRNAVGHAIIEDIDDFQKIQIQKPLFIACENDYNQLELPGLFLWGEQYFLVISTTQLAYLGQSDLEVDKTVRIYRSTQLLDGKWQPFGQEGKHIILRNKVQGLYGPKLIHHSEQKGVFYLRPFVVGETYAPATIGIDVTGTVPKLL